MASQEKLLTPRDVASLLGCSPDHVIQLARNGQLRVAEPGTFWRFRHRDVLEYRERAVGSHER